MVTIVRQGSDPKKTPIQATCSNCYAQIEFLPIEAEYISDQRDGDCYKIACPCCAKPIYAASHRQVRPYD